MKKRLTYIATLLLCSISSTVFATTYYNKSSGTAALQLLSNWGTNTDGTGTAPSNFITAGNVFNLYNGTTATISSSWVITGGTLVVGNGSAAMNLTIPSSFSLTGTGVVNVSASATLTLQNATNPTLGTLNTASTVNYNGTGSQTVGAATYGNLTISGSRSFGATITLAAATVTVSNSLTVSASGFYSYTTTSNTFVYSAAAGGKTIESEIPYNNLTLSNTSGANTANGDISVAGVLTTAAGGTLDMGSNALSVTGSPVNGGTIKTQNTSSTPITTGKTWAGTVTYDASTGGQTVMPGTYATLTLGNSSGTSTAGGTLTVNTALNTTAGGTLDMSTNVINGTLTTITNNGTFVTSNTSTAPFTTGKTWGGSGLVKYAVSTGGQTIMSGTYNCDLQLTNTSGTNTASGVLTINGDLTTGSGTMSMSSYAMAGSPTSITNNGTITSSSTTNPAFPAGKNWTAGSGTVKFTRSTGSQNFPGGTFYNLYFANTSGTNTAQGAVTVTGTLTTTSGGKVSMASYALLGTPAGITNNGTIQTQSTNNPAIPAGYTWTGTTGLVTFNLLTGGQFVPNGTYKTLTFTNTSGTNTAVGNLVVNTSITTSASGGTLDLGTYTLSGTLTSITNTGTLKTANTSAAPIPSAKSLAGTVNYYAASGGQTIVPESYYTTLTLSNTSGTNTAGGNLPVKTALNTTAGGTLDMTASYVMSSTLYTITNNGTIKTSVLTSTSSAPFTTGKTWGGTGTVIYASTTGGQTVMAGTYNCGLTVANTSGTSTASGVITANGTLTTTSGGTLAMSTYALAGAPTVVNNGTITTTSVTVPALPAGRTWTGTTGYVFFSLTTGGQSIPAGTYGTLKCSNTSGTNSAVGTLTVNNSLITTNGGTLAMGVYQLLGSGTATNNGTVTTLCTANPAIQNGRDWSGTTGAVIYASTTGGQYVGGGTYKTLTFQNTSGTNTAVGDIAVNGTMTVPAGGTLDMSTTNALSGTGTFVNNGTIKTSTPTSVSSAPLPSGISWAGTIIYAATTGAQTVVGGTYNNVTFSNTSGTNVASGNIAVNAGTLTTTAGGTLDMDATNILSGTGSFTNNGNIQTEVPTSVSTTPIPSGRAWGGTITYGAATGSQTIVSETSYNNLALANASGVNTSAANLTVNGTLTTTAGGELDMGVFTLGGTLAGISGGGTISTANTSATPIASAKTWTQAIEYYASGGGQTVVSGTYNGGLVNSNTSGTNSVVSGGSVTIGSALTLNAGSVLSDNGVAITLTGSLAGSGSHTGTGSINMTGAGTTIDAVSVTNLTLNHSGGFSLIGTPVINGTLTLASGRLDIGPKDLIFGSSATAVAGTLSSANMILADGGGNVVKQYSGAGSFLFPVGSSAPAYSPITLNFTAGTFGTGASAAVNVTAAKHPMNANTTNYLNRYWSVATSGITSPVYNVLATYVTGDVVGTEASIAMGKIGGVLPWVKYGATNTSTHTLTATAVTDAAADFTGITSANPTLSLSPTATALCNTGSVNITATGGGNPTLSYVWSPSTGLSATTGTSVTAAPTTGTVTTVYVYTVTMTDGNGFTASATSAVTVNPVPVVTGTVTVCVGLTSTLAANLSGGTWTSSNTSKATVGSATGVVTGVATGTANITYQMPSGCRAIVPITMNGVPSSISGATNVCAGGSTNLTESVSGGSWSTSDASVATVGSTGTVTGVAGGSATISYISGPGCYVTSPMTVGPILAITGTMTACVGMTTTLADGTSGGSWSSSNTGVATVGSGSGVVSGVATGTTTISYAIGTGCVRTTTVTVNAVPASITGTTTVCAGLTTTLNQTVAGGSWSSSNTSTATVGSSSGVVTGVTAGTVTISYISGYACYATANVTVNPLPATITGTTTVCAASTTTLSSTSTGGSWTSSNGNATVGSGTGIVTGVTAGTSAITYTLPTGCLIAANVTVNPVPASITGTTNVCAGLTRTLTDGTAGGTWSSSATGTATVGTSGIVTGVAAGNVTISYSLPTGCLVSTPFTVNALPASITGTASVCAGLTTTLADGTSGGAWTSGATGVATIGSSSGTVTGVAAGTANITYTLATGCIGTRSVTVYALPATITGSTNVCLTQTRTLSDATPGGSWSSGNTSVATVGTSGIVTGVATGSAGITYTLATGCLAATAVTVNSLPAGITGLSTICNGSNITLTDVTSGGAWSSNDVTNISIGSSSGIVTFVSADTTTVFYTLPTGCRATKVITSYDVPGAIVGAVDTCVGLTTTVTDPTSGGIWTSSNPSVATIGSASGVVTGISAGTTVLTYTISSTGCYVTAGLPVDPLPAAITGILSVCDGSVTNLDDASGGGNWTSSNTAKATVDAVTGDVTGVAAGTSTITFSLTTGCFTTAVVTVSLTPSLSAVSDNSPICAGTTLSLTSSGPANVATYSWVGPVVVSSSTSSSASVPSATTAADGTYTVTVSNGSGVGCSMDYTTDVTVNPTPAAAPTNNGPICRGGTVTLTATPSGGASVYAWSGASLSSSTLANPTATPTVTTTYSLTVTDGSGRPGCSPTTVYTTTVTVNAVPAAGPTNSGPICRGGTVTLTANPSGGAANYTWSGSSLSSTTAQNPTATPTVTTTYSLTVTDGTGHSGCAPSTVYTTTVTVNNPPSLTSASNGGPICAGGTLTLTANGPSNVSGYAWTGPVAITNSSAASANVPSATTGATGTYTVTVNNGAGSGCTASYTTTATVNATPAAAPTNNGPICRGGTVTLTGNPSGGASVYTWSGASLSSTTAQNPTATPTVTATYSLTVTDGTGRSGCSPATVYTTTVTVNSVPTAGPTNNGPVCSASTVTLTANPAGGADTYVWSGPNLSSTSAQNPTATPTVTSTYSLTVSYGTGRPGCSPSTVYTTTVTVRPTGYWLGTTSTAWTTGANWCGGVPTSGTDVLIPSGSTYYPSVTSGTSTSRAVTIQTGGSLTVSGGTLQIGGAISNSGTFTAGSGTIVLNGSSSQTIPAGTFASNTIGNLTVSNSAGVTVGGTLNISGILKAATGTLTTGGYITLLSSATQTALVDGSGSGTISGNVTMRRYLDTSYGYRYISSPFQAATIAQLSSYINLGATFPNLYRYNENVNYAGWVIDTAVADTLKPMVGYTANFGTSYSASTFSLTGAVSNGSLSTTLYNHNQTYTLGFNLVGNPYPSPIDWNAASGWTKTNIDNAVYYFNSGDTNQYYGTYSSYVGGVSSDGIANNLIPAMQGFFVHVSNGSYPVTGTLGFSNAVRTTNLTPYYHKPTASGSVPLIRLDASFSAGSRRSDAMVVYLDDRATEQFDNTLDALKLMNTDAGVPNLYSISPDERQLSIQAVSAENDTLKIIPLGLSTSTDGVVTFNTRSLENLPAGMHAWLYDSKTGKNQDLATEPQYKANLAAGTYDGRFLLMLSKSDKVVVPAYNGELNAYSDGSNLFVYVVYGTGELVLTNAAGQVVQRQQVSGAGYHKIDLNVSPGVYVATLYSGMGKQSKKIFIAR